MTANLDCLETLNADEIIAISCNICGILFVVMIGTITRVQLSSTQMHSRLEFLFYFSLLSAIINMIGSILSIVLCDALGTETRQRMILLVGYPGLMMVGIALLGSLVARLHLTFKDSQWRISRTKLYLSTVTICILSAVGVTTSILWSFDFITPKQSFMLFGVNSMLYTSVSIWAVYCFVHNMLSLARLHSMRNSNTHKNDRRREQRLINFSSKYVSLFIVAITTTWIALTLGILFRMRFGLHVGTIWSMDCVINILCLYLYHGFANEHYDKYCSGLDSCCKKIMTRNVALDTNSKTDDKKQWHGQNVNYLDSVQSKSPSDAVASSPTTCTDLSVLPTPKSDHEVDLTIPHGSKMNLPEPSPPPSPRLSPLCMGVATETPATLHMVNTEMVNQKHIVPNESGDETKWENVENTQWNDTQSTEL